MRYFTKELWLRINDHDETVRMQAEKEWKANSLSYQLQFEKTREHLSCGFIKDYLFRNGLHDYIILGIVVTKRGREYSCELQLTNGAETVLVAMYGLKALKIDVDSFQCCMQGKLVWGYSEFEITPENNIQLAVLCDMQNEMKFQFKSMKFTKQ